MRNIYDLRSEILILHTCNISKSTFLGSKTELICAYCIKTLQDKITKTKSFPLSSLQTFNSVITRKCESEFQSKIHEALIIKKLSPKLNRQMYANGAYLVVNIVNYANLIRNYYVP